MSLQARGTDFCSPHNLSIFQRRVPTPRAATGARACAPTPSRLPLHTVEVGFGGPTASETSPIRALLIGDGRASDIPSPRAPQPKGLPVLGRDGSTVMPVKLVTAYPAQNAFHSSGASHEEKRTPRSRSCELRRGAAQQRASPSSLPALELGTSPTRSRLIRAMPAC